MGEIGEDETVERGGRFGDFALIRDKDGRYTLRFACPSEVALQRLFVGSCRSIGSEAVLPLVELFRVGIDSLDLLCQGLKLAALCSLRLGGFALVGMFDDIRLLYAVADAEDDFVATAECAVNISDGMRVVDLCHT